MQLIATFICVLLTTSLLLTGCSSTEYTSAPAKRADLTDVKAEISSTEPAAQQLGAIAARDRARAIFAALNVDAGMLCRTLAEAASCDTPYFEVEDSNRLNAQSRYEADGRASITLTRALVELLADDPDALAWIIAHQYGHLISGQILPAQPGDNLAEDILNSTMSVLAAAGTAASSGSGPYGSVRRGPTYSRGEIDDYLNSDIHGAAYDSYSKAEEREADYLATYLAVRNGFRPNGGALIELGALQQRDPLSLYDKLDQQAPFEYWDTHTYNADRVVRVRNTLSEIEWLKSKGYLRPIPPKLIEELRESNQSMHSLEDLVYP